MYSVYTKNGCISDKPFDNVKSFNQNWFVVLYNVMQSILLIE